MIEELTENEIAILDNGKCPDCGNSTFLKGPRGGMCVNIECTNCGSRYNVLPGMKGDFGKQRISPGPKTENTKLKTENAELLQRLL